MPTVRLTPHHLLLGVAAATLAGMLSPPASAHAQSRLSERLRLVERLHGEGDYAAALPALRAALQENPGDYDVRCWMARLLMDSSQLVAGSGPTEHARLLSEEALAHARAAVAARARGAEGWFQVGRAIGTLSRLAGGSESVGMARESKSAFETALSLDPRHAGALHGLARWHRSVAGLSAAERLAASLFFGGLPPASREEAVLLLRRAAAVEPAVLEHHLELARTYVELGRADSARVHLETVLGLPGTRRGDSARREEARRMLDGLGAGRRQ